MVKKNMSEWYCGRKRGETLPKKSSITMFLKHSYRSEKRGYKTIWPIAAFFLGRVFKCGLNLVNIGLRGLWPHFFKLGIRLGPMVQVKVSKMMFLYLG